jgi:transposase InsO family protein
LPTPTGPWKSISLYFITNLSLSKGYDAILRMVDRFTKMAHFLPCVKTFTSQDIANMLMREVFKQHVLLDDIISDQGPQFISKFWQHMLEILKISAKLSLSYHPQTDGQSERTNQTLEQYL